MYRTSHIDPPSGARCCSRFLVGIFEWFSAGFQLEDFNLCLEEISPAERILCTLWILFSVLSVSLPAYLGFYPSWDTTPKS